DALHLHGRISRAVRVGARRVGELSGEEVPLRELGEAIVEALARLRVEERIEYVEPVGIGDAIRAVLALLPEVPYRARPVVLPGELEVDPRAVAERMGRTGQRHLERSIGVLQITAGEVPELVQ